MPGYRPYPGGLAHGERWVRDVLDRLLALHPFKIRLKMSHEDHSNARMARLCGSLLATKDCVDAETGKSIAEPLREVCTMKGREEETHRVVRC
jgi:hypothetical protein